MDKIVLTFNQESYDKYVTKYKKLYPKRSKPPLAWTRKRPNGMLVSWNRFINSPNRIMQNQWKQEFADYTQSIIDELGISGLNIERCLIVVKQYNPTKAKSDSDNIMIKASLDAMVKANVLIEDNYTVLNPVVLYTDYNKNDPRTELHIYIINNNYDDVLMRAVKELSNNKVKC